MKCGECGGDMISRHGTLHLECKALGSYQLHDVDFRECQGCGEHILPNETWKAADLEQDRLTRERIAKLPIGDFMSAAEVYRALGVTRQALHKHRKISNGLVYFVIIDRKRYYHRRSLEQFIQTGDGRFRLSTVPMRTWPLFVEPVVFSQQPAPKNQEWIVQKDIIAQQQKYVTSEYHA